MSDIDLFKLYSAKILKLAADIPLLGQLESPDATVKRRSPLCGSTVSVDISMVDGCIDQYAHDVKACALGQAAASVVAANVVGRTGEEIRTARDQLLAMLADHGPEPSPPFDDLKVLLPAREFVNRHASIMLALQATLEAIEQTQKPNTP
ncbi:MAG: iron-sulfur cluster assembly scaffold protein [Paracoccaceae bacterium]